MPFLIMMLLYQVLLVLILPHFLKVARTQNSLMVGNSVTVSPPVIKSMTVIYMCCISTVLESGNKNYSHFFKKWLPSILYMHFQKTIGQHAYSRRKYYNCTLVHYLYKYSKVLIPKYLTSDIVCKFPCRHSNESYYRLAYWYITTYKKGQLPKLLLAPCSHLPSFDDFSVLALARKSYQD